MRTARRLLLPLLLFSAAAACDDDRRDLPEDAVTCVAPADCADFTDEGGMCCGGICVDCWSDDDQDDVDNCSDVDYLDGICLAD